MTEKQKRIADLKASLLAPQIRQLPKRAAAGTKDGKDDPMDQKFKRKMDWGTPRIVTKNLNRQLQLDNPKQMASRAFLLQMANVRKGNTSDLPEKKKQEFA